ncbi:hypothetical protein AB1L12_04715 [Peribacillus frigoritolerans]|uniref:hypothetical protein n=1 Tax=Peribacillus frigoritolerans TaxID=450367 RepID=UPI0039A1DD49
MYSNKCKQIPYIINEIVTLQQNSINLIKFSEIIYNVNDQLIGSAVYGNSINFDFLFHKNSSPEKLSYTESELLFLLNDVYHISYLKGDNKGLENSPFLQVW